MDSGRLWDGDMGILSDWKILRFSSLLGNLAHSPACPPSRYPEALPMHNNPWSFFRERRSESRAARTSLRSQRVWVASGAVRRSVVHGSSSRRHRSKFRLLILSHLVTSTKSKQISNPPDTSPSTKPPKPRKICQHLVPSIVSNAPSTFPTVIT